MPIAAPCPNCDSSAKKRPILRVGGLGSGTALLRCPDCGCGFAHPPTLADYDAEPVGGEAALAFYLQQGAGLWGIAANLAALGRPAGARMLEVGCGFGLGLDFARRALGWEVLGLDPSPFAAAGRSQLGLPIESRYLASRDAALHGQFDVVMASEVIEHVASPPDFIRTLWAALREGGTLLLTTPDIGAAGPDTPPGLLAPLLSVGYHLVLQSEGSLAALLRGAGFTDVVVHRSGGASLVARGHRGVARPPSAVSEADQYHRYLQAAAAAVQGDGDLWFGLVARSYREAVNKADHAAADATWRDFSGACRRRFDRDPEAGLPIPGGVIATLEDLAGQEPLCLGPVLLHRALHRMLLGEPRSSVESVFVAAVAACERLRAALQRIGTDDGDAEDVAWVARAEGILCAAERGAGDVPERIAALGPAPGDAASIREGRGRRANSFKRRAFVSLVNAGTLDAAGHLIDVVAATEVRSVSGSILADEELDVLYCAAVRELQLAAGSAERALALLRILGTACAASRSAGQLTGSAVTLAAPARDAEILALECLGRPGEAAALRAVL